MRKCTVKVRIIYKIGRWEKLQIRNRLNFLQHSPFHFYSYVQQHSKKNFFIWKVSGIEFQVCISLVFLFRIYRNIGGNKKDSPLTLYTLCFKVLLYLYIRDGRYNKTLYEQNILDEDEESRNSYSSMGVQLLLMNP